MKKLFLLVFMIPVAIIAQSSNSDQGIENVEIPEYEPEKPVIFQDYITTDRFNIGATSEHLLHKAESFIINEDVEGGKKFINSTEGVFFFEDSLKVYVLKNSSYYGYSLIRVRGENREFWLMNINILE